MSSQDADKRKYLLDNKSKILGNLNALVNPKNKTSPVKLGKMPRTKSSAGLVISLFRSLNPQDKKLNDETLEAKEQVLAVIAAIEAMS